jgi:bifunctional non-homologous end joining protein LigD
VVRKVAKRVAVRTGRSGSPPVHTPAKSAPMRQKSQAQTAVTRLTHPERVLIADPLITKQDLAQFYASIAEFILPGLTDRPLMLLRCPDGAGGQCFFQKHLTPGFPATVREIADPQSKERWLYIAGVPGLLGLVQMSAIEYHVWGSNIADIYRADRLIFDLDPSEGVRWGSVVGAALELRERLSTLKLQSFVRTSGGKGLHVVVPLRPGAGWDDVHQFARTVAETLAQEQPDRYLAQASKAERRGRIFIDWLRNGRGATAVCSYSLRNRPGAPVATPLSWEELPRVRAPDQFRYDNIRKRLSSLGRDPWQDIGKLKQALPDTDCNKK